MAALLARRVPQFGVLVLAGALLPSVAAGQAPSVPSPARPAAAAGPQAQPPTDVRLITEGAKGTREQLRELLRQYPPSLSEVLRLDPTLLTNGAYLAPYPTLWAFLGEHPEVARNPSYFVGENWQSWDRNTPATRRADLIEEMFAGLALFLGALTVLGVIVWGLRMLVDHRRWLRLSKIQTEAHTKLLDRLTANEDLLAYVQSPAGRRFLESAPIEVEGTRPFTAPVSRILWSAQAGIVAAMLGFGLLFVSRRVSADGAEFGDMAPFLFMFGMVAVAIGAGFLLSGAIAYLLSRRLGLLDAAPPAPHA
jgi:hypothetical protein